MALFPGEGLTFDDVSLCTNYADFHPAESSVRSQFSRNIKLKIPFISAAMDTVTESEMATAMALAGGIGVIHKNLNADQQADEVRQVKSHLNGLIENPVTFSPHIKVRDLLNERARKHYSFTGFPIIDNNNKLCGILTARDIKFASDPDRPVEEVMTTKLMSGLYSFHDVDSLIREDDSVINRDKDHKLRVAAAISPHDDERIEKLLAAGVDALVVDTAHGHSKGVIDTVKELKKKGVNADVVAGNIASAEAAKALIDAGADAVKVGIGPGSICTTRVVCGVGIPQLTAIYNVSQATGGDVPIIADGGIKYSGDVPKAIAVGASAVMMGSALAGTKESPGQKILQHGRTYVVYRGMGSVEAMNAGKGSRERYGHEDVDSPDKLVPQGIEGLVELRGSVENVLAQFVGGLRFSLGYCGCKNFDELQKKAVFIRVSGAGLRESHPHDIKIHKDAPNYSTHE